MKVHAIVTEVMTRCPRENCGRLLLFDHGVGWCLAHGAPSPSLPAEEMATMRYQAEHPPTKAAVYGRRGPYKKRSRPDQDSMISRSREAPH